MQDIHTYSFKGKRALVRVDFNVPLDSEYRVTDNTRIRAALPTLKKVLESGGSLILMSHLGRPKKAEEKYSLRHILPAVEELLEVPVLFAPDCMGEEAAKIARSLQPGQVLLLENLRFYAQEEGKPRSLPESQKKFTATLASYADCYINDAFGTAHRAHASNTLITEHFPNDKMFGYLLLAEIQALDNLLHNPAQPVTALLGGAKVSSKMGIIKNLLNKVDNLIIGGGMAFTFIKASGGNIGNSLCEDHLLDTALDILNKAAQKGVQIYLPTDVLAVRSLDPHAETVTCPVDNIPDGWMGVDAGSETLKVWKKVILQSKTLLWNGPAGVFEIPAFANGTLQLVTYVAEATQNGAFSLVGGGDSVAAVTQMGYADKVSYVSTGGGAMLEYLEGKELPGIAAMT
ncbi:MAG: phosphoglycerate kinase [Bacteroidales bacterium]|nr:phosphoglycerate kinase [Bacteroidales bacterium]